MRIFKNKTKTKYALVPEDLYKLNFCFLSSVRKVLKKNKKDAKVQKHYDIASCLLYDYRMNVKSFVEK